MWNRNRWKMYSKSVHTKLPRKKQATPDSSALDVIDSRYVCVNGSNGAAENRGRGLENATTERRKRYPAMGSQMVGTTHHCVRVKISR